MKLGWSQDDLALKSGIHRTYVASLETGRRNPSLDGLARPHPQRRDCILPRGWIQPLRAMNAQAELLRKRGHGLHAADKRAGDDSCRSELEEELCQCLGLSDPLVGKGA
jgi:transcriptional regulator with XRE-family HTH domain